MITISSFLFDTIRIFHFLSTLAGLTVFDSGGGSSRFIGLSVTFAKNQLGHTTETTTLKKLDAVFSKCENNVSINENKRKSNIYTSPQKASNADDAT